MSKGLSTNVLSKRTVIVSFITVLVSRPPLHTDHKIFSGYWNPRVFPRLLRLVGQAMKFHQTVTRHSHNGLIRFDSVDFVGGGLGMLTYGGDYMTIGYVHIYGMKPAHLLFQF